jgi:uncharacterized 2Fe-2S/4Fe-4S cluster protein (DUF4445 family)
VADGSRRRQPRLTLQPSNRTLHAPAGTSLRDLLFEQGVEFPCGGNGLCRGCRIRVLDGESSIAPAERERLTAEEISEGWRLACQQRLETDITVELLQWEAAILSDQTRFAFTPHEGLGIAVDVGTTTLATQLLDLRTGEVLAVRTALNPQAKHGADVMSRVQFAVADGGAHVLRDAIRHEIGALIRRLLHQSGREGRDISRIRLCGNTVMHHLFSGVDVEPLSHLPFEPLDDGPQRFSASGLGWQIEGDPEAIFLPGLGGFVGSDILAGLIATGVDDSEDIVGLMDLGTNGEIVIGTRERLLCASTAAGPAFEGAKIAQGMRAATGAIWRVEQNGDGFHCSVLGDVEPRGLCGSGLVDAAAVGLDIGAIAPGGRLRDGAASLNLAGDVDLTQTDIRQLQLAKGAIAAGFRILLEQFGATPAELTRLHLAGAFGNYINRDSARRIGLLGVPPEMVEPAGNTALLGTKMSLFLDDADFSDLRSRVKHVSLHEDPRFHEVYVDEMTFPAA